MLLTAFPQALVYAQEESMSKSVDATIKLKPSAQSPFGEFEGWGTSLCWWANRLGYSETLTQQAAELFFSDNGLGLDIARYNLGGGDDPKHNHITRSDSKVPGVWETFELSEDGNDVSITYDLTNDQNQLNIAKAALAANPDLYFEGFSNSAPYFMTQTGCTSGGNPASSDNLKPEMYDDFAKFIADATKLFKDEGIVFKSYSPMNEPDTDYWGVNSPKQEGCHFDPGTSQSNAIIETRKALDAAVLNDVLVAGMDETSIDKSVSNLDKLTDEAKTALGRIDTHTYSGSKRAALKEKAVSMNKNLWMSEVDGGWDGFGLARRIIDDLNGMQASAWVMWDIIDFHKDSNFVDPTTGNKTEADNSVTYTCTTQYRDFKSGTMKTGNLWGVGMADHDTKTLQLTNKYYAFGQFTRYIQPGMTLIESSSDSLAAYDKKTGEIVIVALNNSNTDKSTRFDLRDFSATGNTARAVRTSASGEKWAELESIPVTDKEFYASLKANSITTFVIGKDAYITEFTADNTGITYKYETSSAMNSYDKYFAIYDSNNNLKAVTINEKSKTIEGDFSGCTPKLMIWDDITPKTPYISEVTQPEPVGYMTINGSTSVVSGIEYEYSAYINSSETPASVAWSVSDDTASVTEDGKLTATQGGTITLTATAENGQTTSIDIEVIDASKPVKIVNKKSGLGLETKAKGITSGSQLVQWEDRNLDTAAWQLSPTADGYFNIINKNADMLLAANADAKPVIASDIAADDNNAKWELINHGGYYEIKNLSVSKSLNVSGQSVANGGSVILYAFGGGDNELWSLSAVEGEPEHVVPVETDYSEKYADSTQYSFVSNISAATNDFNSGDLKGFEVSGTGALTSDGSGESVLGVQSKYSNKDGQAETGSAILTPDTPLTCEDGQIINMAFDIYCSNSGGTADFILYGADDAELVKMVVSGWDNYDMTIGSENTNEAGGAKTYLRNNVNDKTQNQLIANGGHMEIYLTPSTGDITITLKNNTNTSEMKTYTGNVGTGAVISKVAFNANYTTWSKPMYVDNLVTNIITAK